MTSLCILSALLIGCKPKTSESVNTQATENAVDTFGRIEIADIDGNMVAPINEIAKHEYTIIDFWASWCGPCRMAMPYVKQLYSLLNDKGLAIIGISLDSNYDAWKNAVDEEDTGWLQLSELKGWDDTYARKYHVNAIPCFMVVDRQGRILYEQLNIQELFEIIPPLFTKALQSSETTDIISD